MPQPFLWPIIAVRFTVKEHSKEMNPIISAVGKLLTAFTSTGKYTAIGRKLADDGKALLDVVNQFGN
jgi:hypothetical protein